MDSGCVKPGDEFEELYDVTIPLTPEDVLGIIDQLLCHEVRHLLISPRLDLLLMLPRCRGTSVIRSRRPSSPVSTWRHS